MDAHRFCQIALARGLLTKEQVARAISSQQSLSRKQQIGKILVAQGWLTPAQVDEVLHAQGAARRSPPALEPEQVEPTGLPKSLFGQLVLKHRFASPGEVEECVALQREMAARGEYVKLGELLVRRSYLARRDVIAILELQTRKEKAANGRAPARATPAPRAPAPARSTESLARLRDAALAGELDACLAALEEIKAHLPEHEANSERLVRRAFLRVAAERAWKEKLDVKTCDLCETASAVRPGDARCARCQAPFLE